VKYWEIIADNLRKAGWSWGCILSTGRFIVRADEKLTAFLELESATRSATPYEHDYPALWQILFGALATQFAPHGSQAEQSKTEQTNCRAGIGHSSPSDDEGEVLVR